MYYLYLKKDGTYIGSSDNPINTPLIGSTDKKPPERKPYTILKFQNGSWILIPDYRGTWYNKKTKEKLVIKDIGVVVDLDLYTNKEPCNFCIWDDSKNDWVFSLDQYKKYAIEKINSEYAKYLLSKETLFRLIGFTALIIRIIVLMSTNKSLNDDTINTLSSYINDVDNLFVWLSQVAHYESELEDQIRNASTKEEVDSVLSSVNFNQFDNTYPKGLTLSDKMYYVTQLKLVEES